MSFGSFWRFGADFQFCRRGLYKDATSSSRFCITLVYSCTALGFQCEWQVKLLNEKRSLLRRMIRRRGRAMRRLVVPSRSIFLAGQQIRFHFLAVWFGFYGKGLIFNVKMLILRIPITSPPTKDKFPTEKYWEVGKRQGSCKKYCQVIRQQNTYTT